ncbi:NYN domain-containing protein [Sphingopyxis sp. MC1]|uniref:NYN domain-containing protein n=1 Tax=Sphingopyxis sp. MC1 TaxID=1174684 RepID=UPI0003A844FB|nr:NYN domain-containing protein [Sphingopyxis sp. MC1]
MTKSALLVDFDNIFSALWSLDHRIAIKFASEPADWLQILANSNLTEGTRRWLFARCYLNPAGFVSNLGGGAERLYFSKFRPGFVRAGFEVVDCPAVSRGGKNAADIRIVIDALDLLCHRTRFDEFVIASGDSDFTPLLHRLRAEDRHVAVLSPGYLAAAYAAVATRIIGFEALESILNADIEGDASLPQNATATAGVDTEQLVSSEERDFSSFIRERYEQATGPLSLAALAFEAARACPAAKQSGWLGKGFKGAIADLRLPNVVTSQHHIWDDERHQPPSSAPTAATLIPDTLAEMSRQLDLPSLDSHSWQALFAALHAYSEQHEFRFSEATHWTRDRLAEKGIKIARASIAQVARGAQIGGAPLNESEAPSAMAIGHAYLTSLIERAATLGVAVDQLGEQALRAMLGLPVTH